ncbi:MAG: hypothetical protein KC618_09135, partial [Candidatus Omnitrophica bacterium]|nr:hypothetical protein [Candidatus Omnitrophota bacterium]
MKKEFLKLESELVRVLQGRMNLLQPYSEKEEMVEEALKIVLSQKLFSSFQAVLEDAEERAKFIKKFLAYDIVTELLCDFCVEDIIINNLKPIYIHHSQKGFIKTDKQFLSQKEVDL